MRLLTPSEIRYVQELLEMAFAKLRALSPEEIEHRERTRPRTYDLSSQEESDRLLRETAAYAKVSLHYGTDDEGRRYASEALDRALRMGFRLVPPEGA